VRPVALTHDYSHSLYIAHHLLTTNNHLLSLFTSPAPSWFYSLSLHDALPISGVGVFGPLEAYSHSDIDVVLQTNEKGTIFTIQRSEEHTSELQSRFDLVCRLLLEKKKYNM